MGFRGSRVQIPPSRLVGSSDQRVLLGVTEGCCCGGGGVFAACLPLNLFATASERSAGSITLYRSNIARVFQPHSFMIGPERWMGRCEPLRGRDASSDVPRKQSHCEVEEFARLSRVFSTKVWLRRKSLFVQF